MIPPLVAPATKGGISLALQGGCMVLAAKGGIKNGAQKGAVPRQRSDTIYLPRARALNPSGRRQPVPDRTLGAQGQRPGGAINPRPRKTTVGRLNGRPFYGQAKGQLRPTCTSYAGCAHQPSGILESTAQVPVPIPIPVPVPTAPQAPEPSSSKGACPSYKKTGTLCVGFLIASLIVLISERKAARWQCRGRSRGGRFPGS